MDKGAWFLAAQIVIFLTVIASYLAKRFEDSRKRRWQEEEQQKEHAAHKLIEDKIETIHVMINSELERWIRAAVAEALARGISQGVEQERNRK